MSLARGAARGGYSAVACAVGLVVVGLIGLVTKQPWLFPSLGPTVMVLSETPEQPAAHPRSVVVGHVVGVLAGYGCLLLTGLTTAPPATQAGLTGPRVVAAVLSVAVTTFVLQLLGTPHPPAGATTLLVSLGLLKTPTQLLVIIGAVLVVTAVVAALDLLTGRPLAGVRPPRDAQRAARL